MKRNRFAYLIIFVTVILCGLLSRKITFLPFFIGDLLYAVMIYFGIRLVFTDLNRVKTAFLAVLICYCIEVLQLSEAAYMVALRKTLLGRYVLGQGFLWSDLAAYSLGIIFSYYAESFVISKKKLKIHGNLFFP